MGHSCDAGVDFSVIARVALTGRNQRIRLLSFLTTPYALPPQDMFYSVLLYQIVLPYYPTPGVLGTETEKSPSSATV